MSALPNCPQCQSEYTYEDGMMFVCPECANEWSKESIDEESSETIISDANGNVLHDGDTVSVTKDLKVKGANFTAKQGTMVRGISLTDNPEHIEGKVNGTRIVLVAAYLKKA